VKQCQGGPGKLHPMHVRIIDSYIPLSNGCRRTGDTVGAIKNVDAMINAMEFYYPLPCIETTNLYRYLVELCTEWASNAPSPNIAASRSKKQAKDTYHKYNALRSVCQGHRHVDGDLIARMKNV